MCAEAEETIEHKGFNTGSNNVTGKIIAWFPLRIKK
jgi:hypothetical protein